ncbi:hypothetical protein D3C76_1375510 [compost metagenome]
MPAALAALDGHRIGAHFHGFLRMLEGADRGYAHYAGVLEPGDHLLARRAAVTHRLDLVAQHQLDDVGGIGLVHVKVDPERLGAETLGFDDRRLHARRFNGCPGQKAEAAGVAGGGHQLRLGNPAHGGLDDRVATTQQFGERCLQADRHAYAPSGLRWELAMARAS